jgi:hypothetical protein
VLQIPPYSTTLFHVFLFNLQAQLNRTTEKPAVFYSVWISKERTKEKFGKSLMGHSLWGYDASIA